MCYNSGLEFPRLPRFTRSAEVQAFRLTDRDVEIIRLVQGSPKQVWRRLQVLFHNGYQERPRAQIDYFHRAGSQPSIYGLGNKGAGVLRLEMPADLNWKNQSVDRLFLDSDLFQQLSLLGWIQLCLAHSA